MKLNWNKLFATATTAVLLLVVMFSTSCTTKKKETVAKPASDFISPPVKNLDPAFQAFSIDANKDDSITLSSGTVVYLPKGSIVNKNGTAITGKVEIKYREFHDGLSIALAGMPMQYHAAGITNTLTTAGMFEIRGSQNGYELFIDPKKPVKVVMASYQTGSDYHFFNLDENQKQWNYIDTDTPIINKEKINLKRELAKLRTSRKIPFDPGYFALDYMSILDMYLNNNYDNIHKNRSNKDIENKIKQYNLSWLNFRSYDWIKFAGNDYPANMMVWRNLTGKPFPNWMNKYDGDEAKIKPISGNKYAISIVTHDRRHSFYGEIEAIMPIKSLLAFTADTWKTKYDKAMQKVLQEEERLKKVADAKRFFEINKFGIYNWDKFYKDNKVIDLMAKFSFDTPVDLKVNKIEAFYLFDSLRSMIKIPIQETNEMKLFVTGNAIIFAFLPDNKIALFSKDEFQKLNFDELRTGNTKKFTFKLSTVKQTVNSEQDLRRILGI